MDTQNVIHQTCVGSWKIRLVEAFGREHIQARRNGDWKSGDEVLTREEIASAWAEIRREQAAAKRAEWLANMTPVDAPPLHRPCSEVWRNGGKGIADLRAEAEAEMDSDWHPF